jgi:fructoselysine-6-P-deglycase FrlB-like protein/hydroxymethylpyrimidine pyrophosphatase-like HAD family hydrolase
MTSFYNQELERLGETYQLARVANIEQLKVGIVNASEASIIGVGSGGSYTVASLLCTLHETYTGRVSRPSTPLEIISNPTLASASPIFFVSAEGKNPDIIEALRRARRHSARDLHVLTNRSASPLQDTLAALTEVNIHTFELEHKDGYLATNSLILDAVIIARAYEELDRHDDHVPQTIDDLKLSGQTIGDWLENAIVFAQKAANRDGVIVLHSSALKPVATDIESKLSEAALLHCQIADLRSFAHGRHSWLTQRAGNNVVLALVDPSSERLWQATRALIPPEIETLTLMIAGSRPRDLLSGLIAELKLVSLFAEALDKDPARPIVAEFGRELYYIDLPKLVEQPHHETNTVELSKFAVLGAHWPSITHHEPMHRAAELVRTSLSEHAFRALVFDYDGTISSSNRRAIPPTDHMCEQLLKLSNHGVVIGIASGRGDSIQTQLRQVLPESCWPKIKLGLFSGGWIGDLSTEISQEKKTSEFLNHAARIVNNLKHAGVPIETIRLYHPHQVSVRFRAGIEAQGMWFVIVDALRQAGVDFSNVVRSKHSVDILAPGISKSKLITHLIKSQNLDPYQVLTMGDQGAWPGNDSSLLDHKFSLSVATPSRKLDRGWKFAPAHKRDVDATLWYLEAITLQNTGYFTFDAAKLHEASVR